ncbi:MAG TPA: nuclear transport factor 2 family protein [Chloroflexia bacterium]|jgi:hypothetical protein
MATDEEQTSREDREGDEIRNLERQRLRALVEADMSVANELHADDFELITPSGRVLSREQYLGDISSGKIDYLLWEPDAEIRVRVYDQMAVIRYQSHMEIIVRGQKGSFRAWHTDSYERRNGRWQVVWSQATAIE